MNRLLTYVFILLSFTIGAIIPNLINPNQGFIFILEETIGITFFLIGFVLFLKPIRKKIKELNNSFPWKNDFKTRFLKEISYVFLGGILLGTIMYTPVFIYVKSFGIPKFYQEMIEKKELIRQKEFNQPPHRHPPPHRYDEFGNLKKRPPPLLPFAVPIFGGSILFLGLIFIVEESFGLNERLANEKLERQKALKEQAIMKASVLQKQLNPHFMFNTLNVLSGLIYEDIDKADKFIKELSKVYRYVMEQSEEVMSTLEEEQVFIESYIYLLKIRFEEKIQFDINIPESKLDYSIPSMTLELLVENAVKHNIADKNSPLKIEIYIENDYLIVKNNLQKREDEKNSNGIGLSNLTKRLELFGDKKATFKTTKDSYTASVPLL